MDFPGLCSSLTSEVSFLCTSMKRTPVNYSCTLAEDNVVSSKTTFCNLFEVWNKKTCQGKQGQKKSKIFWLYTKNRHSECIFRARGAWPLCPSTRSTTECIINIIIAIACTYINLLQAGEMDLNNSIERVKFAYYCSNQSFCLHILYENAMWKVLSLIHKKLNVPLYFLRN